MKYKNISEQLLTVPTAMGDQPVEPNQEILTAPIHAKPFVERGQLEAIAPKATRPSRKAEPKETAD